MRTVCAILFEMELVRDASDALVEIHRRLAHRHGAAFRALERRLEAVADGPLTFPEMPQVESHRFVVLPPVEIAAVIAEARRLGVL